MRQARLHRVEVSGSIASLLVLVVAFNTWAAGPWSAVALVSGVLLAVQPLGLSRWLEHFLPLPAWARWTAMGCAGLGVVLLLVLPDPQIFLVATAVYFAVAQGYGAWVAAGESGRRVGVTRMRLQLTTAGAVLAAALVTLAGVKWFFDTGPILPVQVLISACMLGCYAVGLAPPRRALRARQQAELVRFLRSTAGRAPTERPDHIADDLLRAVTRGTAAATVAVLLGREELVAYASTDSAWDGQRLTPAVGLAGIAVGGLEPVLGAPDELEPPFNELAAGNVVAVIPVVRTSPAWGVVIMVQRRASLFLTEDLSLISELCLQAADALDHARLLHQEQERQKQAESEPARRI